MNSEFWAAFFSLAWPVVVVWAALTFRPYVAGLLSRNSVTIKIAGFELTSQEAVDKISTDISDIQRRLSTLETSGAPAFHAPGPSVTTNSHSKNLLWVDDYPSNNAFLIDNFRKQGVEVVLSLSTDDALRKLRTGGFQAVISDLGREESGSNNPFAGLELLQSMNEISPRPPVLIFAGSRGIQNQNKLIAAGAESVTSSPIDVVSFIQKHLGTMDAN